MTFTARPPAKLNLTLEVGQRGSDGFHSLRSVFLRIGLSDRLTIGPSDTERDRLDVSGPGSAPLHGNIVLRALALLRRRSGIGLPPLAMELEKHIPLGAGLAGGSSDGAAALHLAAACWGVGLSRETSLELAAELGSDVPFFVSDAPVALVEGRGERVTTLPGPRGRPGLLLVTPPIEISTTAAFERFDELDAPPTLLSVTDELVESLRRGLETEGLREWSTRLRDANDLWPATVTLAPELATLRGRLEVRTDRPWLLTGSGASLFAFYPSPDEAAEAGARLTADESAHLRRTLMVATDLYGPDPIWRNR